MATLPRASVFVDPQAAAPGGGANLVCVLSPCASSDDMQPRLFGSPQAVAEQHGYCEGVEYAAMHVAATLRPVLFVGMPIGTPGAISRFSSHLNSGSSVPSVAAGGDGVLAEHDGVVRVVAGGTRGTDQIKLELSLDNGRIFQPLRLGTASSIVLPFVNVTLSVGAGTLVTGDTLCSWHGSAPKVSTSDLATARANLAAGDKQFRSLLLCGDLPDDTAAGVLATQMNAYFTSNQRAAFARASIFDRFPQARMSRVQVRMTGSPTLTFAEVGASADTITRNTGSWITDGFLVGYTITVTDTAGNNISAVLVTVTDLVLTLGSEDLAAEVTAAATIVGSPTLTFAEVGASGDTITRSHGSWLADGFRIGDSFVVEGTAANDVSPTLAGVTATVLTLTTTDLTAESIASFGVSIVSGETKAAWMARADAEFASIDAQPRIDLSAGRGAFFSSYSGWAFRRPAGWFASAREYAHDLHVPTWRKNLGPLGADLFDSNNDLVEWDDRTDGEAGSAARFTTLRTWANGPRGAFIALSLTRAGDGQLVSNTHNAAVVNQACNVTQVAPEDAIGRTLQLNSDGTATKAALAVIASDVNAIVQLEMLKDNGEGPRCSSILWTPSPDDIYNVAEPLMTGVLDININGTIHSVRTAVRVRANGQ